MSDSRYVENVQEIMELAYRKWNSIILDMDRLRSDRVLADRKILNTGVHDPEVKRTASAGYDALPGEFVVKEASGHQNTIYIGHSLFNVGGFLKTTGGELGNIIELTIPPKPSSGTRHDLVFIEVWQEEVFPGDDLYYNGLYPLTVEQTLESEFLLVLRWRLRIVEGLSFGADPMLEGGVTVWANGETPSGITFATTDTEDLYRASDASLETFGKQVWSTPLLQITRAYDETYPTAVTYIGGRLYPLNHTTSHHTGGSDEITPDDIGAISASLVNQPNGVAGLDGAGHLDPSVIEGVPTHGNESHSEDYATEGQVTAVSGNLSSHESATNPHSITPALISAVPTSRSVNTGTGLTGGGALSTNRNLQLDLSYTDARYVNSAHLSATNPHGVTKAQVGLSNVTNHAQVVKAGDTMQGTLVAHNHSSPTVTQVRNVHVSTSSPSGAAGNNGDIWIQYV